MSRQPDLTFPVSGYRRNSWILTTYLDNDTRVLRSEAGSIYVLIKDLSVSDEDKVEVIGTEEEIKDEDEGRVIIEPEIET